MRFWLEIKCHTNRATPDTHSNATIYQTFICSISQLSNRTKCVKLNFCGDMVRRKTIMPYYMYVVSKRTNSKFIIVGSWISMRYDAMCSKYVKLHKIFFCHFNLLFFSFAHISPCALQFSLIFCWLSIIYIWLYRHWATAICLVLCHVHRWTFSVVIPRNGRINKRFFFEIYVLGKCVMCILFAYI